MDENSKQAHNGQLSGVKKGIHPVNLVLGIGGIKQRKKEE